MEDSLINKKGFIYIFSNPSLKYLKIGNSSIHPRYFIEELSNNESIPTPFQIVHYMFFNDSNSALDVIEKQFVTVKINKEKDFYNVVEKKAVKFITELAYDRLKKDLGKEDVDDDFKRLEREYDFDSIKEEINSEKERIDSLQTKELRKEYKKEKEQHLHLQQVHEAKLRHIKKLNDEIILRNKNIENKDVKFKVVTEKLNKQIEETQKELNDIKRRIRDADFDFSAGTLLSQKELEETKKFTTLKKALQNAEHVFRIFLWNNNMTQLSPSIEKLKNLQELYLWNNNLSVLPEEISGLSNLQRLMLSENQFKTIPGEIFELPNMLKLDMKNNLLSTIPPQINKLRKLEELYLGINNITTLPEEIGDLENLKELDLRGNPISNTEKQRIRKLLPKVSVRF